MPKSRHRPRAAGQRRQGQPTNRQNPASGSAPTKKPEPAINSTKNVRLKRLFNIKVKLPGWLLILVGVYNTIPDWKGRFDFWAEATKQAEVHLSVATTVILSPYFGLCLIASGIAYLAFVGEPEKGVLRHPAWHIVS